ncbi:MAG: penicillin acylase family protein, partial [Candidatus Aminicenantes bacterium]|nr:penicillin acylase family protein [Candidatus Aminicenantes bacterium]
MRKALSAAIIALVFLILGFLVFLALSFRFSLPGEKGDIPLQGLTAPVRVVRDSWGVPHVYALTDRDLFFAAGFLHAQERMWQMELLRRAGFGRLSEIFGVATLEHDKLVRNLGLKEAALKDYKSLDEHFVEALNAYSQGVNAWLSSRKLDWPPEFLLLRFRPEPWGALDSLIIKQVQALILCTD